MTDRTIRFTVVAVILGLLAALLILLLTVGRNGIRIETVGEVRIVGMPSEIALRMADPIRLTMPEGATLVGGRQKTEVGHLEGRSNKLEVTTYWAASPTDNRGKAEWVIRAEPGARVVLTAIAERAGTIRHEITLP